MKIEENKANVVPIPDEPNTQKLIDALATAGYVPTYSKWRVWLSTKLWNLANYFRRKLTIEKEKDPACLIHVVLVEEPERYGAKRIVWKGSFVPSVFPKAFDTLVRALPNLEKFLNVKVFFNVSDDTHPCYHSRALPENTQFLIPNPLLDGLINDWVLINTKNKEK